jgi:Calx-beta domain
MVGVIAAPASATYISPSSNPYLVQQDSAGNLLPVDVQVNGFVSGDQVRVEQCDGVPPSTPGYVVTKHCDSGTSPSAAEANGSGVAHFPADDLNLHFTPVRGESPQSYFNCNAPGDPPLGGINGLQDFTNCQIRVSTSLIANNGDQQYLTITLPKEPTCSGVCMSIGDATTWEDGVAAVPVTLSKPASTDVTATVSIGGGTAVNGTVVKVLPADYKAPATKTVKIKAGHLSTFVSVRTLRDTVASEGDEYFTEALSAPTPGVTINKGVGTVTIHDATGLPSGLLLFGSSSIVETDSGKAVTKASVVLSQPDPVNTVTAQYITTDDGATGGVDYLVKPGQPKTGGPKLGTLTFKPGQTQHIVSVTTLGDTNPEPDEGIQFSFSNPVHASFGFGSTADVTIIDND